MFLLILGTCTLAAYGLGHYREIQTSETIAKTNALAEQSRTENLRLTKQIEEERTRRAMIELRLAPRRLDIAQYELIVATLRRFRAQKLNVLLYAEAEPRLYGEAIIKALTEANWNLHVVRALNTASQPVYGAYIAGPHPESSPPIQALISVLVAAGNPIYAEPSNDAEYFLSINLKPEPGVSMTLPKRDPARWRLPQNSPYLR